mgnify:CR=1 FL=1
MTFLKYRSLLKVRKKGGRFYSARGFFRYNKKSALIGGNQGEKEKVKCKERRVKEEKAKEEKKKEKGANDAIRLYKHYR